MQVAALVEQLEFQLGQFGQVGRADGAVGEDEMPGDAPGFGQRQAAQVAHDHRQHGFVYLDAAAAVFLLI